MTVVPLPELSFKIADHKVFPAAAVVGEECQEVGRRVAVPPQLQPLDGPQTPYIPIRVGPPMTVGPDNVDVKPVDEFLAPDVALELSGTVHSSELVVDFNELIVENTVGGRVAYPLRLSEAEIEFEVPRVPKPTVLCMQCKGVYLGGVVGRH